MNFVNYIRFSIQKTALFLLFSVFTFVFLLSQNYAQDSKKEKKEEPLLSKEYEELHLVRDYKLNSYVRSLVDLSFDFIESNPPEDPVKRAKAPKYFVLRIINDPSFNACVYETGETLHMDVNMGLLRNVESEDQLVDVLEHEISHYLNRDTEKNADKQHKWNRYAFSQQQEDEADRDGLIRMVKLGYNPYESVRLEYRLNELHKSGGSRAAEILSTHPNPILRAQRKEELIKREKRSGRITTPQESLDRKPLKYSPQELDAINPLREYFEKEIENRKLKISEPDLLGGASVQRDAVLIERIKLVKETLARIHELKESFRREYYSQPNIPIDYLCEQIDHSMLRIKDPSNLKTAFDVLREIYTIEISPRFTDKIYYLWYKLAFSEGIKKYPPPEKLWGDLPDFTRFIAKHIEKGLYGFLPNPDMVVHPEFEKNDPLVQKYLKELYLRNSNVAWVRVLPKPLSHKWIVKYMEDCSSAEELLIFKRFIYFERGSANSDEYLRQAYFTRNEVVQEGDEKKARRYSEIESYALASFEAKLGDVSYAEREHGENVLANNNREPYKTATNYTYPIINKMLERAALLLDWSGFIKLVNQLSPYAYDREGRNFHDAFDFIAKPGVEESLLEKFKQFVREGLKRQTFEQVIKKSKVRYGYFTKLFETRYGNKKSFTHPAFERLIGKMQTFILEEVGPSLNDYRIAKKWIGTEKERQNWVFARTGSFSKSILLLFPWLPGGKNYAGRIGAQMGELDLNEFYEYVRSGLMSGKYEKNDCLAAIKIFTDGVLFFPDYLIEKTTIITDYLKQNLTPEESVSFINKLLLWIKGQQEVKDLYGVMQDEIDKTKSKEGREEKKIKLLEDLQNVFLGKSSIDIISTKYRNRVLLVKKIVDEIPELKERISILFGRERRSTYKDNPFEDIFEYDRALRVYIKIRMYNFELYKQVFEKEIPKIANRDDPNQRYRLTLEFFKIDNKYRMFNENLPMISYLYDVFTKRLNIPISLIDSFLKGPANESWNIYRERSVTNPYEDCILRNDRERFADFQRRLVNSLPTIPEKMEAFKYLLPTIGSRSGGYEPIKGDKSAQALSLETLSEIAETISNAEQFEQFMKGYEVVADILSRSRPDKGMPEEVALGRIQAILWEKYKTIPNIPKIREPYERFLQIVRLRPYELGNWNCTLPTTQSDKIFVEEILPALMRDNGPYGNEWEWNALLNLRHPKNHENSEEWYKWTSVIQDKDLHYEIVKKYLERYASKDYERGLSMIMQCYPSVSSTRDKILLWWGNKFTLTRERTENLYSETTHVKESAEVEIELRVFANIMNKLDTMERVDLIFWLNDVEELDRSKSFVKKVETDLEKMDRENEYPKRSLEEARKTYKNLDIDARKAFCNRILGGEQTITGQNIKVNETLEDINAVRRFREAFAQSSQYPEGSEFLASFIGSYFDALDRVDKRAFIASRIIDFESLRHQPEELLASVLHDMGIVGAKVAQLLGSARGFLPESYIKRLSRFRDQVESPFKYEVMRWLDDSFGNRNWENFLLLSNNEGSGSVGVGYRAKLFLRGENGEIVEKDVFVKIRREAIIERIKYDVAQLTEVIEELSKNGFRKYAEALRSALKEVVKMLNQEVNFPGEVKDMIELKEQAGKDPKIKLKYVTPITQDEIVAKTEASKFSNEEQLKKFFGDVIIMEIATGKPLTKIIETQLESKEADKEIKAKIIDRMVEIIGGGLRQMLIHRKSDADPQAGNFFVDIENQETTRLDIGQKYDLTKDQVNMLIRFIAALDMRDGAKAAEYWVDMTHGTAENKENARGEIKELIDRNENKTTAELYLEVQGIGGRNNLHRQNSFFAATKELQYYYELSQRIEEFNSSGGKEPYKRPTLDSMFTSLLRENFRTLYAELFVRGVWVKGKRKAAETYNKASAYLRDNKSEEPVSSDHKMPETIKETEESPKTPGGVANRDRNNDTQRRNPATAVRADDLDPVSTQVNIPAVETDEQAIEIWKRQFKKGESLRIKMTEGREMLFHPYGVSVAKYGPKSYKRKGFTTEEPGVTLGEVREGKIEWNGTFKRTYLNQNELFTNKADTKGFIPKEWVEAKEAGKSDGLIVDLGSGDGTLVKWLLQNGYKNVIGIDAYITAEQEQSGHFRLGMLQDLKALPDHSVSLAISIRGPYGEGVDHASSEGLEKYWKPLFETLKRKLRPDGKIILSNLCHPDALIPILESFGLQITRTASPERMDVIDHSYMGNDNPDSPYMYLEAKPVPEGAKVVPFIRRHGQQYLTETVVDINTFLESVKNGLEIELVSPNMIRSKPTSRGGSVTVEISYDQASSSYTVTVSEATLNKDGSFFQEPRVMQKNTYPASSFEARFLSRLGFKYIEGSLVPASSGRTATSEVEKKSGAELTKPQASTRPAGDEQKTPATLEEKKKQLDKVVNPKNAARVKPLTGAAKGFAISYKNYLAGRIGSEIFWALVDNDFDDVWATIESSLTKESLADFAIFAGIQSAEVAALNKALPAYSAAEKAAIKQMPALQLVIPERFAISRYMAQHGLALAGAMWLSGLIRTAVSTGDLKGAIKMYFSKQSMVQTGVSAGSFLLARTPITVYKAVRAGKKIKDLYKVAGALNKVRRGLKVGEAFGGPAGWAVAIGEEVVVFTLAKGIERFVMPKIEMKYAQGEIIKANKKVTEALALNSIDEKALTSLVDELWGTIDAYEKGVILKKFYEKQIKHAEERTTLIEAGDQALQMAVEPGYYEKITADLYAQTSMRKKPQIPVKYETKFKGLGIYTLAKGEWDGIRKGKAKSVKGFDCVADALGVQTFDEFLNLVKDNPSTKAKANDPESLNIAFANFIMCKLGSEIEKLDRKAEADMRKHYIPKMGYDEASIYASDQRYINGETSLGITSVGSSPMPILTLGPKHTATPWPKTIYEMRIFQKLMFVEIGKKALELAEKGVIKDDKVLTIIAEYIESVKLEKLLQEKLFLAYKNGESFGNILSERPKNSEDQFTMQLDEQGIELNE